MLTDKIHRALRALRAAHSALDRALGDTDITHLTESELRDDYPVQWAAQQVARAIDMLESA